MIFSPTGKTITICTQWTIKHINPLLILKHNRTPRSRTPRRHIPITLHILIQRHLIILFHQIIIQIVLNIIRSQIIFALLYWASNLCDIGVDIGFDVFIQALNVKHMWAAL